MAQTFNMGRYVPPDLEGTTSHNVASGKGHALGVRARKLKTEGVLVVRFECPFAIWCTHCQPENIIGQGVRFNAEKKKVGNYYTTPIWSFRFKHTICGQWLEVRTDPQNAEYVVVQGGRRRDLGDSLRDKDSLLDDGFHIGDGKSNDEEKDRLEKEGGFAALEKKVADKNLADSQTKRIEELSRDSDKNWADPYEMSRRLRKEFRVGRRQRQADEKSGDALKDKYGIGLDLLAPTEEDEQRSKLVSFGDLQNHKSSTTKSRGLFDNNFKLNTRAATISGKRAGGKKKDSAAAPVAAAAAATTAQKVNLQTSLQGNTRIVADPFMRDNQSWAPRVKRKRVGDDMPEEEEEDEQQQHDKVEMGVPVKLASVMTLVNYESDSS